MLSISQQLKAAINAQGLTLYGAAMTIGADDPGTPLKTIHKRLTAYTSDNPPKSLVQLEQACKALGLTITIE